MNNGYVAKNSLNSSTYTKTKTIGGRQTWNRLYLGLGFDFKDVDFLPLIQFGKKVFWKILLIQMMGEQHG